MKDLLIIKEDLKAYPSPEIAGIKEFRELIRRDRGSKGDGDGRLKQRAARELAYIYHMVNHNSSYAKTDPDYRKELLIKDLFADIDGAWKPDALVDSAMEKYKWMIKSEMSLLLDSAVMAVNKLRGYFETLDLNDTDINGKPTYSAKDVVSNLSNLGKVVEGVQKLREQVEKDELGINSNRKSVETNEYSE